MAAASPSAPPAVEDESTERYAALTDPDHELTEYAPAVPVAPAKAEDKTTDPGAEEPRATFTPLPPGASVADTGSSPPIHDEDGVADDVSLHDADGVAPVGGFEETLDMPVVDDVSSPKAEEE